MQRGVVSGALVVVGLIHLLPLSGVLGAAALERLYGVALADANLSILLQHRAVLFGLLGMGLVWAAFVPRMQAVATVAGAVSVVSFLVIAQLQGPPNAALGRVVMADWIAVCCLLVAAALLVARARSEKT